MSEKTRIRNYERRIKPAIDKALSFAGLMLLSPLTACVSIAIYLDDPGPVFFMQKRVGKDKKLFVLHKFRTMKLLTPHDVPTHQLDDPEQYITKVGRFLRKYSFDELPQLWDIFRGKMSIIGPRPALWNQKDLVAEREKYGANSIMPGLTGWAQINGRDTLEITEKAKFDGAYTEHLKQGGMHALLFDVRCFAGTIIRAFRGDGVVEGGTGKTDRKIKTKAGTKRNRNSREVKRRILVVCQYYYPETFQITSICEALVQDGYQVTVLTGLPNYPAGIVPDEYKHGHRDEYINGVHVLRCYEAGRKKGAVYLALNYATFTIAAMKKVRKLKGSYDLVFCYQLSPVFMGMPARNYAREHHIPFLLYCCDLWPESVKMYASNEKHLVFKLAQWISRKVYQSADRMIVQSESFIDYMIKAHEISRSRLTYIPAFADETYLTADFTPENRTVDFVFLGNLGIAQDLFSVLDAVKRIKDMPGFRVHFVGNGACLNEMRKYVKKEGLKTVVRFYGQRPVEEMPKYYKLADACLVSLKADNATGHTMPLKVQGYMAAGKPVIAMCDGSARDVIEEAGCGICVGAGNAEALSLAMRDFIENPHKYKDCGEKGRSYFKSHFTKRIFMDRLERELNVRNCKQINRPGAERK